MECLSEGIGGWGLVLFLSNLSARERSVLIRFNSGKVGFFVFQFQSHLEEVPYIDALEPAMALAPVRPRSRMPRRN